MTIPLKVFHRFIEHGAVETDEPITNLSGTVLGSQRLKLDVPAIRSALVGIPLPPEVSQELAAASR
ncbi:hypothetical protein D3C72_1818770 [compost metagenome]